MAKNKTLTVYPGLDYIQTLGEKYSSAMAFFSMVFCLPRQVCTNGAIHHCKISSSLLQLAVILFHNPAVPFPPSSPPSPSSIIHWPIACTCELYWVEVCQPSVLSI